MGGLFAILISGAQGCAHVAATVGSAVAPALAGAALGTAALHAAGTAGRLLANPQVLDNLIERIDRAVPEMELLKNRDKWEDALKEYNAMWEDAVKQWADVLKKENRR